MKKILLIILDGLGDRPIPQLGNKTPLEAANTPHLDFLAKYGKCGLMEPVYTTKIPTSEECHFSLFGYDPRKYVIKRGIFTAMGSGLRVKPGDVALRGNFSTVDEKLNIIDRRAGRITNTAPFIKSLNGLVIEGVKFLIKNAGGHRIGIVMRGKNLSPDISDGDPHYSDLKRKVKKIVPLKKNKKAKFTAEVLNKFLERAHLILKNHPLNKKREKAGLFPANYILVRGASSFQKLPTFQEKYGLKACGVAGKLLYQQIAKFLGMRLIKVKGANGLPNTNLKGKIKAVKEALKKYDFVFLHIKATDSLAEDGDYKGKRAFIEKVDEHLKPLLASKNILIVVSADHCTCSLLKRHCIGPVPILIYGNGRDKVEHFSERECKKGGLGTFKSLELIPRLLLYRKEDLSYD